MHVFVVGGIYTVIKTKAAETVAEYGEQFFLFGPYKEKFATLEVEVIDTPPNFAVADTIKQMKLHNIKVGLISPQIICMYLNVGLYGCLYM